MSSKKESDSYRHPHARALHWLGNLYNFVSAGSDSISAIVHINSKTWGIVPKSHPNLGKGVGFGGKT